MFTTRRLTVLSSDSSFNVVEMLVMGEKVTQSIVGIHTGIRNSFIDSRLPITYVRT